MVLGTRANASCCRGGAEHEFCLLCTVVECVYVESVLYKLSEETLLAIKKIFT